MIPNNTSYAKYSNDQWILDSIIWLSVFSLKSIISISNWHSKCKTLPQILLQSALIQAETSPVDIAMPPSELWNHHWLRCFPFSHPIHHQFICSVHEICPHAVWLLPQHRFKQLMSLSLITEVDCHLPACFTSVPCRPLSSQQPDGCFNIKVTLDNSSFQDPLKAFIPFIEKVRNILYPALFVPWNIPSSSSMSFPLCF